ncbi:MAG: excinuclease ABC subunit UvrA [Lachnospiraceae bacterium]|nr:excinuclease ABC subunit UvrA [Lachnospiraceae bacterium]
MKSDTIKVIDAYENNLQHISLDIPKYKITVFTGVSGSGKSSLVLDTVAAQSRRELNDTFPGFVQNYLPKYGRPHVGQIESLPVAIVIDQKKPSPNLRSTVGTYTDMYTLLRLLFSRVGQPFVGYSDTFSFNHPQGRCPRCDGLGEITELDVHKLVDFDKCLNDPGVIHYVAFEPGQWRWIRYANSGLFDLNKKIKDYSEEELELFLYSPQIRLKNPPQGWPKTAKYEGLVHRMYRSVLNSEEGKLHRDILDPMTRRGVCPDCGGARLRKEVLSCRLNGKNIAEATALPLRELMEWLEGIESPLAEDIRRTLGARLQALIDIGLDYLSLDRGMSTLSGGEAQRCKIAKYMNSALSDILYILDEPSVGLHSHDIHRLLRAIKRLRDGGNTVLLVEHHREMIQAADHIVDMGPEAGAKGGRILFEGSYEALLRSGTDTGELLKLHGRMKSELRQPTGWFSLEHAGFHNLKDVSVRLPLGVLAVIAGVAGSGKSSLMECFCRECREEPVYISQKNIGISLRSTPATYVGAADEIRKIFARRCKAKAGLFSFNGEGKCPVCGGKGVIVSEMAFMDSIETVCEACGGLRYSREALQYQVDGRNIAQVMDLSVEKAEEWFAGTEVADLLHPLSRVGLSYLHLNQALSTLSGGELQRMKLASYLNSKGKIFILDEPTDGLHIKDIRHILELFHEMVDQGNSVFLVEHNLDVLRDADYVIELGPGGGGEGGRLLFAGTPREMLECRDSVTARYLRQEENVKNTGS